MKGYKEKKREKKIPFIIHLRLKGGTINQMGVPGNSVTESSK